MATLDDLERWLRQAEEDERLEFKAARKSFDFRTLIEYCVALANEGGGKLVLGVSDSKPRQVVGSSAFQNLQKVKADLIQNLRVIRVDAEELSHPDGRVIVFDVPPRPLGLPLSDRGRYLMRGGEGLIPMTPDRLRAIFDEASPDYSADVIEDATLSDLSPNAAEEFRERWIRDSGNTALASLSMEQLLRDADLINDRGITRASLVLLGTQQGLSRHLAQAEVVFEYRSTEASVRYQQRLEFREGFLLIHDDLWKAIALRNETYHYQEGLFRREIPVLNEQVVREAILNAIAHRDYRMPGSVFVRQFPDRLQIESPGGFPSGITVENILWRHEPRNRLLSETLERCGLVERSGQGMDVMFGNSIQEGKLPPDFSRTDEHLVCVTLHGRVREPRFIGFLEAVSQELQVQFSVDDLLALDHIQREQPLPPLVRSRLPMLLDNGIVERVGRGRGTRYLLSQRFYGFIDESGTYTRRRGLDRETNKALLLQHIEDHQSTGSRFRELHQVLPSLSRYSVQAMLRELKSENKIHSVGVTRGARWYPGPDPSDR